jgi:phosphoglucomutase
MVASMLMTEILAYAKSKDKNILDLFEDMYQKYGYYKEFTKSFVFKGIEGEQKIKGIMENLRNNLPTNFGEFKVIETRDYQIGTATTIAGEERKLNFRPSNVLYFELENNAWFAIRPSGTEPKVKLYFGVKGKTNEEAKNLMSSLYEKVTSEINIKE